MHVCLRVCVGELSGWVRMPGMGLLRPFVTGKVDNDFCRVFTGASACDAESWKERLKQRTRDHCSFWTRNLRFWWSSWIQRIWISWSPLNLLVP